MSLSHPTLLLRKDKEKKRYNIFYSFLEGEKGNGVRKKYDSKIESTYLECRKRKMKLISTMRLLYFAGLAFLYLIYHLSLLEKVETISCSKITLFLSKLVINFL
jgi:hypothetical protein